MNQTYWVIEYIKVLLVYGFMLYIWPSVVFRPHLAGKGRAYRFCFCVNSSIILINTAVLLLGLMHILNQVLVTVLYLGVFLVQLFRNYGLGFAWVEDIRSAYSGTMTVRRMLLKWHTANSKRLKSAASAWWQSTKGSRLEYAVLCVIVLFGMAYFSINSLQLHSYGFSDQYVHHAWIYGLLQGKAFSAGIYPEGMHTFIYLMHAVFRVSIYSCNLFLGGIHIQVYLLSAYLLSRELFGWKMSGLFALVGFLTIEQVVVKGIFSVSRFSGTLPQEFVLYAALMAPYGLIRFLRSKPSFGKKLHMFQRGFWKACFTDENLVIFMIAVAASICVHFYATIIAAFVCLAVVCMNLRRFFRRGAFVRIIAIALVALVIASFPMALARVMGYKLQDSLYWAVSVMSNSSGTATDSTDAQEEDKQQTQAGQSERSSGLLEKTYYAMYGENRGRLLIYTNVIVAGFAAVMLCFTAVSDRKKKMRHKSNPFTEKTLNGYLIIAFSVIVLFLAYKPRMIGLPSLIESYRLCSTIDVISMMLFACLLDILFILARTVFKEGLLEPISAIVCIGIYILSYAAGIFHGYPLSMLSRYPIAVELTKEITGNLPVYSYTIVSPTDELYQVIETGFHEEWIDLVEKDDKPTYTIPTPYVFFFIEKHPLVYAQYCFASGPKWLAAEKYSSIFGTIATQYPNIRHREVSEDGAAKELRYGSKKSDIYKDPSNRVIIESKAFAWYQKFSALHPNDGEVIYEDEDFLCYCVRQNEFSLFSLGVMD